MEQTILYRGVGLFATLIGIQQWLMVEATAEDFFFIVFATALLILLEANVSNTPKKQNPNQNNERLGVAPFLEVSKGALCAFFVSFLYFNFFSFLI